MPSQANLAKIHIAIKEIPLDDQTYRDILRTRFRKESAAHLNDRQCTVLLNHFRTRYGWKKPAKKARAARAMDHSDLAKKARALWISLHEIGAVRDPGEPALLAYVKRMTGIDAMQWLDGKQWRTVIESLKKWLEREEERQWQRSVAG